MGFNGAWLLKFSSKFGLYYSILLNRYDNVMIFYAMRNYELISDWSVLDYFGWTGKAKTAYNRLAIIFGSFERR